ncbi:MAG: RNA 2',3'-cyclic phosphodiesterase [Patescibacteria group bacterium]|nr:RNA 2',3'-cyclic phosphodiesterase [Patescibacteria group bacterium]
MKKRIFITIGLPDEIKRELLSYEKRWKNLHVKWTNFYKLHTTIEFLGEVNKNELEEILSAAEKTALEIKPFQMCLDKIVLGPDIVQARMFWVTILIDANMMRLKRTLEQNLKLCGFEAEEAEFKPHIVLARARGNQLKGKQTNIVLRNMKFKAEKIEIMESQLRPNIEKHKLVESFQLAL